MTTLKQDGTKTKSPGRKTNTKVDPKSSSTSERAKLHPNRRERTTAYERG
jgi:hypothetical protein